MDLQRDNILIEHRSCSFHNVFTMVFGHFQCPNMECKWLWSSINAEVDKQADLSAKKRSAEEFDSTFNSKYTPQILALLQDGTICLVFLVKNSEWSNNNWRRSSVLKKSGILSGSLKFWTVKTRKSAQNFKAVEVLIVISLAKTMQKHFEKNNHMVYAYDINICMYFISTIANGLKTVN